MFNLQNLKLVLVIGIVAVLSVLIHQWNLKYDNQVDHSNSTYLSASSNSNLTPNALAPDLETATTTSDNSGSGNINNNLTAPNTNPPSILNTEFRTAGQMITVNTDVLSAQINLAGGNLIHTSLLNYPVSTTDQTPIDLLNNQPDSFYVAQSGLIGEGLPTGSWTYKTQNNQTVFNQDKNKDLKINLYFKNPNGLEIIKQYVFHPHSYLISVDYQIKNNSGKDFSGRFYGQLLRIPPLSQEHNILMSYSTFTGAAYSSSDTRFDKLSFAHMGETNLKENSTGGWVSMVQHYFISAWIPDQNQNTLLYSRVFTNSNSINNTNVYGVGLANPIITIPNGSTGTTGAKIYVGPAISKNLEAAAPNLNLTIDYGWLWFISELLFWVMAHIYSLVGNWGVAIIGVTILIKLIFYPLSAKSFRSMGKMRLLQPKMQELKKQYGDDRQAMGRATMELYKKEKVNPLSSCLPILIQIPVFIGLYWMLMASVELRQAPFIFWIKDLSLRDPYFILPVLMGLSMFLQQRLSPKPADPTQAKVMMFLPIVLTLLFLGFPAGLVLYWIVNNCVGILQQWYVLNRMAKEQKDQIDDHHAKKHHVKPANS